MQLLILRGLTAKHFSRIEGNTGRSDRRAQQVHGLDDVGTSHTFVDPCIQLRTQLCPPLEVWGGRRVFGRPTIVYYLSLTPRVISSAINQKVLLPRAGRGWQWFVAHNGPFFPCTTATWANDLVLPRGRCSLARSILVLLRHEFSYLLHLAPEETPCLNSWSIRLMHEPSAARSLDLLGRSRLLLFRALFGRGRIFGTITPHYCRRSVQIDAEHSILAERLITSTNRRIDTVRLYESGTR